MIIYNITIKIQSAILSEWLAWLTAEHIPAIINTGCFTQSSILQLLEIDDSEGPTYAIQFHAESKAQYNRYVALFSREFQKKAKDKWGQQFVDFSSVMQVVN